MTNDSAVQATEEAYAAARDATEAVLFGFTVTEEQIQTVQSALDSMTTARVDAVLEDVSGRTEFLHALNAEMQKSVDVLQSSGLGAAIQTLEDAKSLIAKILQEWGGPRAAG